MRRTLIVTLLVIGLLATPLALAQADAPSAKGQDKAAAAKAARDNRTANRTHNDTGDDNATGKPAWVGTFQAALRALRESWTENASAIREKCHAAEKPGNNSSKDARLSWAHCIRDGYKAWFEHARAERKEARMARDA